MGLEKAPPDEFHEDRSPQPSLVDRDRLASLRNDLFNNRIPARPPADDAPILQARVSIPDSAPDRRQWLKQQSSSRRRRRRSSKSPAPQEGRGKRSSSRSGYEDPPSSRDSSLGGGESDASSAGSRRSTTPDASGRQRQPERQLSQRRYGSAERSGSAGPRGTDRSRRSSHGSSGRGVSPSVLSSARGGGGSGGGGQPGGGGSLSRNSSSSSLSTTVSSSSLGSSTSLSLRWCGVCEAEFTRLRRPHRCRRCLEAVCAPCSPARLPVPGARSREPKRTCKRCAGRSSRPQVDVVASPRRPKVTAPAAGTQRRASSLGSMVRAPLGVFSGVAAAVKYTTGLYPATAAPGAAVDGAEDAGKGRSGGLDAGVGGGGGESGEAAGPSSGDQAYFPTRMATGGLAAFGRWRAGIGLSSVEKPSQGEPSASASAAGVGVAETKAPTPTPTPGGEGGAKASLAAGADAAVGPFSEAAEELSAASAPAVGAEVAEAKAPASEAEAGAGAARPDDVAEPLPRVEGEPPSTASTPAAEEDVAEAKASASADDAPETFPGVTGETSRASTPAVAAEAGAPVSEGEAAVGAARTGVEDPSAGVGGRLPPEAELGDAWTMVEDDIAAEAPVETVGHVGDTRLGPAGADAPGAVSGGDGSWGGAPEVVGSRGTASVAALEEKVEDAGDASGVAVTFDNTPARSATAQAAEGLQRTPSEEVVDEAPTCSPEEVAPSGPLRQALRFLRRFLQPHVARLCQPRDPPPEHGKESVVDILPVLRSGSPIALECCAAFGIDAAAWMQTAHIASESYLAVEEQAKKRLARRWAHRRIVSENE